MNVVRSALPPLLALLFAGFWSTWDVALGVPHLLVPSGILLAMVAVGILRGRTP